MKDIEKMNNKDNQRRNVNNTVYGNVDGIIDFHIIDNVKIDDVRLGSHIKSFYDKIDASDKKINKLVEVIGKLHNENKALKERLDKYGI